MRKNGAAHTPSWKWPRDRRRGDSRPPDVVCMDLRMPAGDGLAAARQIAASRRDGKPAVPSGPRVLNLVVSPA